MWTTVEAWVDFFAGCLTLARVRATDHLLRLRQRAAHVLTTAALTVHQRAALDVATRVTWALDEIPGEIAARLIPVPPTTPTPTPAPTSQPLTAPVSPEIGCLRPIATYLGQPHYPYMPDPRQIARRVGSILWALEMRPETWQDEIASELVALVWLIGAGRFDDAILDELRDSVLPVSPTSETAPDWVRRAVSGFTSPDNTDPPAATVA